LACDKREAGKGGRAAHTKEPPARRRRCCGCWGPANRPAHRAAPPPLPQVKTLLTLLEGCLDKYGAAATASQATLERLFLYCLTWSLGGLIETKDRPAYDAELRNRAGAAMPPKRDSDTIYEFLVSPFSVLRSDMWQAAATLPSAAPHVPHHHHHPLACRCLRRTAAGHTGTAACPPGPTPATRRGPSLPSW
jgi:hypothetical protein